MRNMFGTLAADKRMDAMEREIPSQRDDTRFVKRQFDRTCLATALSRPVLDAGGGVKCEFATHS